VKCAANNKIRYGPSNQKIIGLSIFGKFYRIKEPLAVVRMEKNGSPAMLYFFGMSITICKRFIFVNNYPIWIPIIDIIACDQLWNSTSIDV